MDNEKVSIIVPIYNAGKDLEQCIESIVNQTYNNIEIILVNDGSTDESLNICKKWELKDNRIIIIDKSNGGLASSRNSGLERATGEYIGFVDHDDYIEQNMYEVMMRDMREKHADIVMCSSWNFYEDGTTKKAYQSYDSFEIDSNELIRRMLKYEKIFCSSVWSKLYKKSIIKDIRFVDEIVLGEDYFFNGRLYPRIKKFYYESAPLYHYRVIKGSMSRNKINAYFFDKYKVVEGLADYYEGHNYVSREKFNDMRFAVSYEILYGLYKNNGSKQQKSKWKKIFTQNAKKYNVTSFKNWAKIFMMRRFTNLYVKITNY